MGSRARPGTSVGAFRKRNPFSAKISVSVLCLYVECLPENGTKTREKKAEIKGKKGMRREGMGEGGERREGL